MYHSTTQDTQDFLKSAKSFDVGLWSLSSQIEPVMNQPDTVSPQKQSSKVSIVRFISAEKEETSSILRRALIQHFHSSPNHIENNNDNDDVDLFLSNKYFDAQVRFSDIGNTLQNDDLSSLEDGIILTFLDSNTHIMKESFDALDSIHSLAQSIQQCGDKLRLCIGIHMEDTTVNPRTMDEALYEEEYQRRILWCLDRGYEYIEADMSEQGRKRGHADREKEGYARIIEAVEATLWSSAIRVSSATTVTTTKSKDDNKVEVSKVVTPPTMKKTSNTTNQNDDSYFENLDSVMRDAIRIRDDARSGTLSDEDRRKRAGDAAIALMGLLEQMGLDEDEEEDGDSEVE